MDGWLGSALTQQQYCRRHGISVGSLQRWRRIFRDHGLDTTAGTVTKSQSVQLLPVKLIGNDAEASKPLTLWLPEGLCIKIPPGFDAVSLQRLLAVLRAGA